MADSTTDEQVSNAGQEPGDVEGGTKGDGEGRRKRSRRRGGRGRGKKDGNKDGQNAEQSDATAQPADEPAGDQAPAQRKSVEDLVENWEEIFENRTFADIGLRNSVVKGTDAMGFKHPTKIQADMIPPVLEGKDVLGQSRTGTGKTAAFALPLFNLLERDVEFQVVILGPTRELAIQITEEIRQLGQFTPISVVAVYGGQPIPTQVEKLKKGPEIIVATPGRLLDLKERRILHFDNVKIAVLDEVDRMLDIGFRDDIRKILGMMKSDHQTVFVSATIDEEIEKLARKHMHDPVRIETTGSSLTVSLVKQHYLTVQRWDKKRLLRYLLKHEDPDLTLIFCRMKRTVDDVARFLQNKGIDAHTIHGDMYQGQRNKVMERLRAGELSVLIASDLAARGLDVSGITHVVNYDLPEDPEVYIHRIGRTARAGREGSAWSFVTPDEGPLLTAIEMLANAHIESVDYPDFKPGPLPQNISAERDREARRREALQSQSRYNEPTLPRTTVDESKFPGGLVPTKLPPKRMGGRLPTSRSKRGKPAPPPEQDKPKTD